MKKKIMFVLMAFMISMFSFSVFGAGNPPSVTDVDLDFVDIPFVEPVDEDLLVSYRVSDDEGDDVKVTFNWEQNGESITKLNMPFEKVDGTTSNNAVDYSGYGLDGTEAGGVYWYTGYAHDGKGAYYFAGSNGAINIGHDDVLDLEEEFTIEAWIRPYRLSGYQAIVSKDVSPRPASLWLSGDKVQVWWGSGLQLTSEATLSLYQHYHLLITYKNNKLHLYVNGDLDNYATGLTDPPTNTKDLALGERGDGNYFYKGFIDDVRIYDQAISEDQIDKNYVDSLDEIDSSMTYDGDKWSVDLIPNDGNKDGTLVASNLLSVPLTQCKNGGWMEGEEYFLTTDILDHSSGDCMVVDANHTTLDCQGHTIDGTGSNYGVYALTNNPSGTADNFTLKNCVITEFGTGVKFDADWGNVTNNSINSNTVGFEYTGLGEYIQYWSGWNFMFFENNTLSSNTDGMAIYGDKGRIKNNTVLSSSDDGIYIDNDAHNNLFRDNTVSGSSGYGIEFEGTDSMWNTFLGDSVSNPVAPNVIEGVEYYQCTGDPHAWKLTDKTIDANGELVTNYGAMILWSCTTEQDLSPGKDARLALSNVVVRESGNDGLYIFNSNVIINGSEFSDNVGDGIQFGQDNDIDHHLIITNATITNNGGHGIHDPSGYNNVTVNGTATLISGHSDFADAGIYLFGNSEGWVIGGSASEGITVSNNYRGIYISGNGALLPVENAVIQSNVITSNTAESIYARYTENALFSGNTFSNPASQRDHIFFDLDNDYAEVTGNTFYQSAQGTSGVYVLNGGNDNMEIYGNTFDGAGGSSRNGITFYNGDGAQVYNNVFKNHYGGIASGDVGVLLNSDADNHQIWNNDFINNTRGIYIWNGLADNNVFDVNGEGNYWDDYDESAEGCDDVSPADGFCDLSYDTGAGRPYTDTYPVVDNYPWTTAQN